GDRGEVGAGAERMGDARDRRNRGCAGRGRDRPGRADRIRHGSHRAGAQDATGSPAAGEPRRAPEGRAQEGREAMSENINPVTGEVEEVEAGSVVEMVPLDLANLSEDELLAMFPSPVQVAGALMIAR